MCAHGCKITTCKCLGLANFPRRLDLGPMSACVSTLYMLPRTTQSWTWLRSQFSRRRRRPWSKKFRCERRHSTVQDPNDEQFPTVTGKGKRDVQGTNVFVRPLHIP